MLPKNFPLGLNGLFAGYFDAAPNPATFKDQEDFVRKLIDEQDEGVLALIYKSLYSLGFRSDNCDAKIRKLRDKLAAP